VFASALTPRAKDAALCGGWRRRRVMTGVEVLDGAGEEMPGHRFLEGTDLDIAHNLQGDNLVLRVNKGGVLVFRAMPAREASTALRPTSSSRSAIRRRG
jgi:hypothetical protein